MANPTTNRISCTYSLLDTGRAYTGRHRKYLIDNARDVCNSDITRERIRLREAVGFYGHGRRQLAGRMYLGEVEMVQLPGGSTALISNIPSNITLSFDVKEDGTITHEQEILDTEPGQIVAGLHASKVGGFSWACPGKDGGRTNFTRLSGFAGFDYVLSPGFSGNRGYVLESADGDSATEQLILESVAASLGGGDEKAEQYVKGWMFDYQHRLSVLESMVFEAESREAENIGKLNTYELMLAELGQEKNNALVAQEKVQGYFQNLLTTLQEKLPFFIPESVMHDMMNGDLKRAQTIFESASLIDFSKHPLKNNKAETNNKTTPTSTVKEPEWGSAEYGMGINL